MWSKMSWAIRGMIPIRRGLWRFPWKHQHGFSETDPTRCSDKYTDGQTPHLHGVSLSGGRLAVGKDRPVVSSQHICNAEHAMVKHTNTVG